MRGSGPLACDFQCVGTPMFAASPVWVGSSPSSRNDRREERRLEACVSPARISSASRSFGESRAAGVHPRIERRAAKISLKPSLLLLDWGVERTERFRTGECANKGFLGPASCLLRPSPRARCLDGTLGRDARTTAVSQDPYRSFQDFSDVAVMRRPPSGRGGAGTTLSFSFGW